MIFDSHTHLNAEQFNEEIPETIARAHELGVTKMAVVGFDQPTIEKSLALSQEYDGIYSIIGWHPTEAGSYTKEIEAFIQERLTQPKVVALGEIGLDYHWMEDPKEVQSAVFVGKSRSLKRCIYLSVFIPEKRSKTRTRF